MNDGVTGGRGGRGGRLGRRAFEVIEQLEARVLLDGDHPELPTPFNPAVGTVVALDMMTGQGTATGTISPPAGSNPDDDLFRFTVTTADFVTILANTAGLTSNLNSAINVYNSVGILVASGVDNGPLTSVAPLRARDGWVGFLAQPGDYYVQVFGEANTTGDYQLRVDATTTDPMVPIPLPTDPPPVEVGEFAVPGTIADLQGEVVFRIDIPNDPAFDSMATVVAAADSTMLDTRLEIYNAQGVLVAQDSDTAFLTSAFVAWKVSPGERFFVRVRSDDLLMTQQSLGDFGLLFDVSAYELATPVDAVTRRGLDGSHAITDPFDTDVFVFQAQGTGLTFVTAVDLTGEGGFAIHLYDSTGVQIAFDDDFVGTTPQIEADLIGGQTYWVVVQSFEPPPLPIFPPAAYLLAIEAHHTTDATQPVDDHVNTPANGTPFEQARRAFDLATPLIWGPQRLITDGNGNPVYDHGWVTDAAGTGRIHNATDTDLFSFVPPVDMLGVYGGDNDDAGTALYVGGNFLNADPDSLFVTNSAGLATWDAGDWWFVGRQGTPMNPLGLVDNINTMATAGPEIYTLFSWDQPNSTGQPILIVGGDFTLNMIDGTTADNLAAWAFDPFTGSYHWFHIGSPDAPVRAITSFDPEGQDGAPDPGPSRLIIGGDFTNIQPPGNPPPAAVPANHIAGFTLNPLGFDAFFGEPGVIRGGWGALGTGINGPVFALAVYDPEDAGDERAADMTMGLSFVPDTIDPPLTLFVGGQFTNAGGVNVTNLAQWNGVDWGAANFGTPATNGNVNGPVHSLTVWDPPDPEGGMTTFGDPVLIIGGVFTNAGGVAANNIAVYGRKANPDDGDPQSDPMAEPFRPRLLYEALGTGVNAGVFATIVVPHFDADGTENGQDIIVGGAFTMAGGGAANHIALFDDTAGWSAPFGDGFDDTVFTLAAFADEQEPGLADGAITLYAGGAFLNTGMDPAPHAARFDAGNNVWVGLNTGVDGTVFAMAAYDDGNPNQWDRNDRPSSRAVLTVSPTADAFVNIFITVFDSNLNVIYTNDQKTPFPDPAGSLDPAVAPGTDGQLVIGQLWAGETYYIEVRSATQAFRTTGRYTLTLTVDAVPVDLDMDGALDDPIAFYREEPDAGNWSGANRINVQAAPGDMGEGDGSNDVQVGGQGGRTVGPPTPPAAGNRGRIFGYPRTPTAAIGATPTNFLASEASNFGTIETIDDTDLYYFRAGADGYVEIRINSTNIQQQFFERIWDFNTFPPTAEETLIPMMGAHSINSKLQSVIRVFDNDQTQIALSGYNPGVGGENDVSSTGRFLDRTFYHRDARVVIPVQTGRVYFIQVESGQLPVFQSDPGLVDWRNATGAYELLINATPAFTPNNADDHANTNVRATPVPIGINPADPATNGRGSVTGVIRDVANNPDEPNNDRDRFVYYATGNGPVVVTASAVGSTVSLAITVVNDQGGTVATGLATPGGSVSINWVAEQGQRFFIIADGAGGTQGAYRLDVVGIPYVDDHADTGMWINATPMVVNAFLGTAVATGRIEVAGDSDVFTFTSDQWSIASVTVESLSLNSLNPFVRVYEIQEDPAGNQYFAQISYNDNNPNGPTGTVNPFARFSVSPDRSYFFVVEGVDPNFDFGNYQITVRVNPTDDHPNRQYFPLSTNLTLANDPSGFVVANVNGIIEIPEDDDVFRFVAPAGGMASLTLTRLTGDFDPIVRVLNSANVNVTGSPVGDTMTPGTVTFTWAVTRSQTYYIQVDVDAGGGTGTYTLNVQAPANDDHPNSGEFGIASLIAISSTTGIGTRTGTINPSVDTDLFRFNARVVGDATIEVTTPGSNLNPRIQVYDANFTLISGSSDDTEGASQVVTATTLNQAFYILVLSDTVGGGAQTGSYTVSVTQVIPGGGGGGGGGGGNDDHANAGNFGNASPITLDPRTGDGSGSGIINTVGDTDLFRFTTPAFQAGAAGSTRPVYIQIVTPSGGLVDGTVRVFVQNSGTPGQFDLVGADNNGYPGNTAALTINAPGNTTYYVLVEPVGNNTGSYSVRVDTSPTVSYLYYPEGYTANTIDEFIPLVNPNSYNVRYTIIARYEVGTRDQVLVQDAVIPANSRGGITISRANDLNSMVRRDTPYALEIQADGPLGATFSHYDFGVTTGENFTSTTSTTWTFAEANRDGIANPATPGNQFNDFVVFYNPNNADANVTITLTYDDGTVTTLNRTVGALRRSGINFDTDNGVTRNGRFSVRLTADLPLVAAMSSYDIANSRGYGLLGDSSGGSASGALPLIFSGNGVQSSLGIYNATGTTATVTITASYIQSNLPDLVRVISLGANSRRSLSLADLGVVAGQATGIRYTSTMPVTFTAIEYKNGDGDASATPSAAYNSAVFGDAFVGAGGAGTTYIEQIGIYNPTGVDTQVAVRFLFTDGTVSAPVNVTVAARRFSLLDVDQAAAILGSALPAFSIRLDSASPFIASFTHYDLFLGGGWSTTGSPLGLQTPLSLIS